MKRVRQIGNIFKNTREFGIAFKQWMKYSTLSLVFIYWNARDHITSRNQTMNEMVELRVSCLESKKTLLSPKTRMENVLGD